ncbi:MAG TPA: NADPH-dependent F420 reductase [Candidatus Krumholzibacteria bacterium]|nr:NADPH-dependent F420 reductase [Candidatus Krumholzibacteria bacterium]
MTVLRRLIVTVLLLAAAAAQGRTIAVIGTGDVGSVLGRRWSEAGHTVIYGSRAPASARVRALLKATGPDARADTPAAAAAAAEVVVLAVPFHAVEALLPTLGDLGRRIVIDCTNPLTPDLDGLVTGPDRSGAEIIASLLPRAQVVKALNTTGVANMEDPVYPDGPLTMLLAGESAMAKAVAASLVEDLGFEAVDAGPLAAARWLEPMAVLWIELARRQPDGADVGFRLVRRPAATPPAVAP